MAVRITVRLIPRGGRDALIGWDGDTLRVRVAAPPVEDRANQALLRLIARELGIAPSRVTLIGGAQARTKTLRVEGLDEAAVHAQLASAAGAASRRSSRGRGGSPA